MDKLKMQTPNKANENFEKLSAMFPNAITESIDENGEVVRAIDKDVLMQEISCKVVDGKEQRYQFTWPDKRQAILNANAPISKTLRPCKEESVDFDNAQNLYIEGDNLDVLKLLQETYLNKVKMIYIDPPYNTGNDFVYNDNFAQSMEEYSANSGQYDEVGNLMVQNTESNGRFHTDWLNMIYPRLKLAKDLLTDDGVIFISIDDNEVENMKKICDEIFGFKNFVSQFVWQSTAGSNTGTKVVTLTEYILCYGKIANQIPFKLEMKKGNWKFTDEFFNERGKYELQKLDGIFTSSHFSSSLVYPISLPNGRNIYPGGTYEKMDNLWNWRWSKTKVEWGIKNGFIDFVEKNGKWVVYFKNYEKVDNNNNQRKGSVPPKNTIGSEIAITSTGTMEINSLFNTPVFEFSKASKLIKHLCNTVNIYKNDIILDFFSGSATTAHAVMQLNAEDGGNRKFILVQLPEKTDEKSEAFKAGYKNICEIGKERIRRAGAKIKQENPLTTQNLDTGFRVLKCDSTNMKEVFYNPDEYEQNLFSSLSDNIKQDRTSEDLLFQVMLDLGVLLSSKIEETTICGKRVFNVADGFLYACFDSDVSDEVVKAIAEKQPYYAVFRDDSMNSDSVMTNFDQIFAAISPNTVRKVL